MTHITTFLNNHKLYLSVLTLMVIVGSSRFLIGFIEITGESMSPTLTSGDWTLVLKKNGPFPRGSILLVRPKTSETLFVKRLIGQPGERLEFKDGYLYINDKKTEEPYVKEYIDDYTFPKVTVPQGHIFVLGDNRFYTEDSRHWGSVPVERIHGRVLCRF